MGHHDAGLILSRSQSRGGGTGCGNRPVKERDFQNDSIRPFRFVPSHFGCYHPLSFHRSTDSVILHQPVINRDGFMVLRKNHVFIGPASKIIFLRIYRIRGRHGFQKIKSVYRADNMPFMPLPPSPETQKRNDGTASLRF